MGGERPPTQIITAKFIKANFIIGVIIRVHELSPSKGRVRRSAPDMNKIRVQELGFSNADLVSNRQDYRNRT